MCELMTTMPFHFHQLWIAGFSGFSSFDLSTNEEDLISEMCVWCTKFVVIAVLENSQPDFNTKQANVTVIAGETAVLPCEISDIGDYEVVWMNPKKTLISKMVSRLLDDTRISVERPFIPTWNLHIRKVRYDDRGLYVCTLNTKPIQKKYVNLIVQVIPDINEEWSSGNKVVKEGETVELTCNATGVPRPSIRWFRKANGKKETLGRPGEILVIHNISRHCDGIYECVADNGVANAASKDINVSVQFPPEVTLLTKRMGHSVGKETILSCDIAASPQAEVYWKKGNKILRTVSGKTRSDVFHDSAHVLTLHLQIMNLQREDFGNYTCEASNRLGKDSETMVLYEYHVTTFVSSTKKENIMPPTVYDRQGGSFNGTRFKPHIPNQPALPLGNNNGCERNIKPSVLLCALTWTALIISGRIYS